MKTAIEILFSDNDLLVVNKPSGIAVIPERIHTEREHLQNLLEKDFEKIFVVHRIDKGTSGVVCFARNEAAHKNLSLQFQEHSVKKIYKALVKGRMKTRSGTIDFPIAENNSNAGTMKVSKQGKNAITHFKVEEEFKSATLLSIEIETGRTHQIRVHMAHYGNPLLVDEIYSGSNAFYLSSVKRNYKHTDETERPAISRLTLHAGQLTVIHPSTEKEITFTARLPKDLETVLKLLRKYDA